MKNSSENSSSAEFIVREQFQFDERGKLEILCRRTPLIAWQSPASLASLSSLVSFTQFSLQVQKNLMEFYTSTSTLVENEGVGKFTTFLECCLPFIVEIYKALDTGGVSLKSFQHQQKVLCKN